jgi:hypothetical protein
MASEKSNRASMKLPVLSRIFPLSQYVLGLSVDLIPALLTDIVGDLLGQSVELL